MTSKGEGLAHFVIDHGLELETYWIVFITDTNEVWQFSNIDVRSVENKTLGRGKYMANWIKKAVGKNPGGLHKSLGVPEGKKIPAKKVAAAAKKGGKIGKEAKLAQTLSKLRKK